MKNKKILLAAGIFYPDVGGPAIHVMKIAERLSKEGFDVSVLAYGDYVGKESSSFKIMRVSRKWPKQIQWLLYFFNVLWGARNSNLVYAFDPTAAGIPAYVAAKIFCKKFIIRIGGDPIWERVVEKNKRFITIEEYYKKGYQKLDMPILYKLIKALLKGADAVVVYNQFFKDFYENYFNVTSKNIYIVKNPAFKREVSDSKLPSDPRILFAGRFVSYKNLPLVMRAFNNVRKKSGLGRLVLIGDGPEKSSLVLLKSKLEQGEFVEFNDKLTQEDLFKEIRKSAFALAPALNEFNPNFILESLSFGKPVIISRGNGLSVALPEVFLFDPFSEKDLQSKMEYLLNASNYSDAVNKIKAISMNQSWDDVTDFHINLMKQICQK